MSNIVMVFEDSYENLYLNQGNKGCIVGHVDLQRDPQIPRAC